MATYVNVTVGGGGLLDRDRQLRQASRFDALEQQQDKELEAEKKKQAEQKQGKTLKPVPYKRDPAAHRNPATLMPFAINWKGVLTGGTNQTVETILKELIIPGAPNAYDKLDTTFTGGRHLDPHPIRFATDRGRVSVTEVERTEPFTSDVLVSSVWRPDGTFSYQQRTVFANQWLERARRFTSDPFIDVMAAPSQTGEIGPVTYTPSVSLLSVLPDGTVFLVFSLPAEPAALTARSYADWNAGGFPVNSLVSEYPVDLRYSNQYSPWYGQTVLSYTSEAEPEPREQRLLFMRIQGQTIQHKIETKPQGTELKDFYSNAAYVDDPSIDVRSEGYMGEYRVDGSLARLLWFGNPTPGYKAFPFEFLESYRTADDGTPVINDSSKFVDHTYQLTPWSTAADLKAQLDLLRAKGNGGTQPIKTQEIQAKPTLFSSARRNLGTDGDDFLTPNLFVAIKR